MSLVRLLDSSLVCHWCVVGVSLVCRWCVTDLSLTCLFVCLWPVAVLYLFMVTGPSFIRLVVRLFVHYWCVCSLFVCGWSVAGPWLIRG